MTMALPSDRKTNGPRYLDIQSNTHKTKESRRLTMTTKRNQLHKLVLEILLILHLADGSTAMPRNKLAVHTYKTLHPHPLTMTDNNTDMIDNEAPDNEQVMADNEKRAREEDDHQDLHHTMDPPHLDKDATPNPSRRIQFEDPTPSPSPRTLKTEPTKISTTANRKFFTQLFAQLSEADQEIVKKPYEGFISDEDNNPNYYHFHSNRNTRITYAITQKIKYTAIDPVAARTPGPTTLEWVTCVAMVFNNKEEHEYIEELVDSPTIYQYKASVARLAFTPPQTLFTVQKSKTDKSEVSKAWYAAKFVLGSWYTKAKGKTSRQSQITDFSPQNKNDNKANPQTPTNKNNQNKEPPTRINNPYAKPKQNQPTEATAAQQQDKHSNATGKPPKKVRTPTFRSRKYTVRLKFKLPIKAEEGKSPTEHFIQKIKEYLGLCQTEDKATLLLPWKCDDKDTVPIADLTLFPTTITALKPYADKLRIKNNSTTWFMMYIGSDIPPENITSARDSPLAHWFQDNGAGAYMATVQNSDDTVDLCDLVFSGPFVDHVRLTDLITKLSKLKLRRELRFGIRPRINKEIPKSKGKFTNWTMADNQPLHVEVDRQDATALKALLSAAFNKKGVDRNKRLGQYPFKLVPTKENLTMGTAGQVKRQNTLKMHQALIQSLTLITSDQIKYLDTQMTIHGEQWTLRKYLCEMTFPLYNPEEEDNIDEEIKKPNYMFWTMDWAPSGPDAGRLVYFTVYNDRAELAQRLVPILPALVNRQFGMEATKKWFQPQAIPIIEEVKLDFDDGGNWQGTWTTQDDEALDDILTEDLGFDLQFDNIELVTNQNPTGLLNADDASIKSFGTFFGREIPNTGQTTPSGQHNNNPENTGQPTEMDQNNITPDGQPTPVGEATPETVRATHQESEEPAASEGGSGGVAS